MTDPDTPKSEILLECRPAMLHCAIYDRLPFPQLQPVQEVAFDLGVTAIGADFVLTGAVIRAYAGPQLLMEQRWPVRHLLAKTGLRDTEIPKGTGIAVRSIDLHLPAYDRLTHLELIAVVNPRDGGDAVQTTIRVPVDYPELQTELHFPLEGAWWAIQAGDWSGTHKQDVISQPFAVDFVKLGADNQFFAGSGATLEDHYSWGQPVYAAAAGSVVYAGYDMPDNAPGVLPNPMIYSENPRRTLGNAVALDHGNGECSFYAHLQQGSLEVRAGESVERDARIGRVGNSGHSPGPHLHFHVMNGPRLHFDLGLPIRLSYFSAGGQFYSEAVTIPTRMIVTGPPRDGGRESG